MSGGHVPAVESSFLDNGVYRATCSCGWRSQDGDGVDVAYRTPEFALAAAQRHAQEAASEAPRAASEGSSPVLHFGDLCRIVVEAGLGEVDNAEGWLAARGLCEPALAQYARGLMEAADESGHDRQTILDGIFTSGLTLGIAIAEAQR